MEKDENANAVSATNIMLFDASKIIVTVKKDKLVVLQGLENYIVIDTGDVLLICDRNKEQEVKEYVSQIKIAKGDKYL